MLYREEKNRKLQTIPIIVIMCYSRKKLDAISIDNHQLKARLHLRPKLANMSTSAEGRPSSAIPNDTNYGGNNHKAQSK